tara:strand:- start:322 stop:1560 length:1239 start_codon:yes stop_codon:yes gene_type:complete
MANKDKLRILVFKANDGGCAYYRAILPFNKLQEHYPEEVEVIIDENPLGLDKEKGTWEEDFTFRNLKWADIVVINNISNYGGNYAARVVGKAREFGKFVQMDTDDLLTDLYDDHRLYGVYKEKDLGNITKFMYGHSHLISVTSSKFAERIVPFATGALAVIKNAIDYDLPCWNTTRTYPKRPIRIGWAGGIHHDPDVKEFAGIPNLVNQKVGRENIIWDFYGRPPFEAGKNPKDWQQDVWNGYKRVLLAGFKGHKNWNIHFAMPPDQYGAMYANMDIAIAPLQMNNFNDSKSDIKVAECGRYKVPLVCSDVGCYNETIKNGETGYLVTPGASKMEWVRTLTKMIKNHKQREAMGRKLHSVTELNFNINTVVHERLDLYEETFKALKFDPRENRKYEDEIKKIDEIKEAAQYG